jgi:hypothetical protein
MIADLSDKLCKAFCSGISINPVASGSAISSVFKDDSGDRISFYLSPSTASKMMGRIWLTLLRRTSQSTKARGANYLMRSCQKEMLIGTKKPRNKTTSFPEADVTQRVIKFLSSISECEI